MVKIKIDKERTWLYLPVNNIVIKVDLKGNNSAPYHEIGRVLLRC